MSDIVIAPGDGSFLPPITRALYGFLGFEMAAVFDPGLPSAISETDAEAVLVLPKNVVIFDHGYNRTTQLELCYRRDEKLVPVVPLSGTAIPAFEKKRSSALADGNSFMHSVERVRDRLQKGEAIQVVLSTPFNAPVLENPFSLYRRLRRANPSPYMFYMNFGHDVLLGSSPEVMVTCEGNRLRLCPIAGTRPRSGDFTEDALFGDELLQDPKETAEHAMLVDLGKNDLGRIAKPGSMVLERFMEVERFSHVMHLTSRISAELADGLDALDVLAATFPAGTVSGAPKRRAMQILAEEEKAPRGPYAGAIGWIGLDKGQCNVDFGITIRSLWVREGKVHWQAGAGIVHDSVPEREWEECLAKAAVIREVVSQTVMQEKEVAHVCACR